LHGNHEIITGGSDYLDALPHWRKSSRRARVKAVERHCSMSAEMI
jgi:hypothetical protein